MQTLTLKPMTMKQQLFLLIAKHGLHEVLDRLEELVDAEAVCRDSHDLHQVVRLLEQARAESLKAVHHEWE